MRSGPPSPPRVNFAFPGQPAGRSERFIVECQPGAPIQCEDARHGPPRAGFCKEVKPTVKYLVDIEDVMSVPEWLRSISDCKRHCRCVRNPLHSSGNYQKASQQGEGSGSRAGSPTGSFLSQPGSFHSFRSRASDRAGGGGTGTSTSQSQSQSQGQSPGQGQGRPPLAQGPLTGGSGSSGLGPAGGSGSSTMSVPLGGQGEGPPGPSTSRTEMGTQTESPPRRMGLAERFGCFPRIGMMGKGKCKPGDAPSKESKKGPPK